MPTRAGGRPRDTTIDERTIEATRALLLDGGLPAATVEAIAERAAVHTSAIYRRWPSRLDLVEDAAFGHLPPGQVQPTGDLRDDLRRFLEAYVTTFDTPIVRAAMPALLASYADGQRRSGEALTRLSVRPQFRAILAAAPPGTVDPTVDPDDVFDLLLGAVLVRVMVPDDVRQAPAVERTVDLVLRLLSPTAT